MADEIKSVLTAYEIDAVARRGELRRALDLTLEAIKDGSVESDLYYVAADYSFRLGDLDKALQLVNSLLVCDPQHLGGWHLFGEICIRKNDIVRAGHAERMVETLFPASINRDIDFADSVLKDNNNQNQNKARAGLNFDTLTFADICASQGYYHKALKIYQDHLLKNPDDEITRRKIEDLEKRLSKNDRSAH